MAHLLSGERPVAAAYSTSFFAMALAWLGKVRAQRNRRVALSALLEFDEHRLRDLGLSRQDVADALRHPGAAETRRAKRTTLVESNAANASLFDACDA